MRARAFTDSFKSSKGGVSLEDFKAGARSGRLGANAGVDCKEQVLIDTIQSPTRTASAPANDDFGALEEQKWASSAAATTRSVPRGGEEYRLPRRS